MFINTPHCFVFFFKFMFTFIRLEDDQAKVSETYHSTYLLHSSMYHCLLVKIN